MIDNVVNGETVFSGIDFLDQEYRPYGVPGADSYDYIDNIPVSGSIVTEEGEVASAASLGLVGVRATPLPSLTPLFPYELSGGNFRLVFKPSINFLQLSYAIHVSCLNGDAYIELCDHTEDVVILYQTGTIEKDWLLSVDPLHTYGLELHASTMLDLHGECYSRTDLYVLSSIPEPVTFLLLVLGAVMVRRKFLWPSPYHLNRCRP